MSNKIADTNSVVTVETPVVNIPEKVIYTGLFINEEEKNKLTVKVSPMFEKVFCHHLTLKFRPVDGKDGIDVGKKRKLKIVAQVIDNELGVQAALIESGDLQTGNKTLHITISTREGVPPVKSTDAIEKAKAQNSIIYFDEIFEIETTEGYFNGEKVITSYVN